MADLSSLRVQLQKFLKIEGHYKKGPLDGVVGPQMKAAIASILKEYKIPCDKWALARRLLAVEQLFYKSLKLYSGPIDGQEGPDTKYAREQYEAKQVTTWRDTVEETIKVAPEAAPVVKAPVAAPSNKTAWPRQSGCGSFYGGVGTNQATAIMPYEMCLAWETKSKVTKFSCHKKVKEPIERIFGRTLDYYGYEKIKELRLHYWGGCLNVRKMRGGSSWSMHAWGIAVDMDPDRNQLKWGRDRAVFAKPEYKKFWEFVYDEGAISLGIERNYDWMHFQFARL
jgi:hypothetical protein